MLRTWTEKLNAGADLESAEVDAACEFLFDPAEEDFQKAGFLEALHRKGETAEEVADFVRNGLARAAAFPVAGGAIRGPLIDVCGTGGDRRGLFNISTTVMFVAAACGACVVKHGNRSITSTSGGADVLEALSVKIDFAPDAARHALECAGCVFLFAPLYHPAFKAVAAARRILAQRGHASIFNMLGPLMNPAQPEFQLAGVFDERLLPIYGKAFQVLGRRRAWAVHGRANSGEPIDEMSTLGPTRILEVQPSGEREWVVEFPLRGGNTAGLLDLAGGSASQNAAIIEAILAGNETGPRRDIVAWNAAGALVVCGLAADLDDGLARASNAIDSGEAMARLEKLRAISM